MRAATCWRSGSKRRYLRPFWFCTARPRRRCYCVDQMNPAFGDTLAFHACLDGAALAALAGMSGTNTFWASARNYNRLTALPRCRERLQALQRFPFLVAPILLTHQRWPNLFDPKRFRWRAHDETVVAAIEQGRDLTGALAACYGISRGLVRSPLLRDAMGCLRRALTLIEFLQFVDAISLNRRPQSVAEVDAFSSHLPALWGLFGAHRLAGASAFRVGYARGLGIARTAISRRSTSRSSILGTICGCWCAGYWRSTGGGSILAALPRCGPANAGLLRCWWRRPAGTYFSSAAAVLTITGLPGTVPAILGEWREADWQARELATREQSRRRGGGHVPLRCRLLGGLRS